MPRAQPESWQRNVWALSLIVFTAFVGFQFFSPFLPLYVQELGVTDPAEIAVWSGVLMAVTPGLAGLLGPLWGRLADRVGRKLMMIRSLAGFIVTIAAMGLVTSVSQLLVARLLQGVFAGFSVMAMALASVSCPRDKVPVAMGRVQSAQLLSAAIGPAAGGYVASHFGIRYAFFVTAGLCALSLIGLIVLFKEARPGEAASRPAPLHFRDVFRLPHFALVLGLLLIAQFIDRGLSLLIPLKVAHLPGVERIAAVSGIIISVSAVCGTISASLAGRLAQSWPIARLLLIGCLAGGIPCALMAWTELVDHAPGPALSGRVLLGRGADPGVFAGRPSGAQRQSRRRLRLARARRAIRVGGEPVGDRWPRRPEPARSVSRRRRPGVDGRRAAARGGP